MNGSWKRRIPRSYIEDVACCYVWNKSADVGVDVVICTKSGQLLEFSNKRICGVCEIQTTHSESINSFQSYDPLVRYYIIKAGSVLHIVAKKEQLKVVHKYENVKHYSIKDFTNCGAPQVGIWLDGNDKSSPDILTDFTEGTVNNAPTANDAFSQIYNERLQEIKLHVMDNEQKLKAMRNCRRVSTSIFLEHREKQLQMVEPDLICLVGPKNKEMTSSSPLYQQEEEQQQQLQQQSLLIDVTEVWQRIYCRKWIVGISINNTGESSIDELNLILTHEDGQPLNYSTQIFSCKADLSTGDAMSEKWQNVTSVPRKTKAVVMGILKQPAFLNNPEVTITGVITYSYKAPDDSKPGHQLPVPNFTLNAEEFSQKLLLPFTGDAIEDADLLSVMVAGEHVTLAVNNVHCPLQEILQLELGFEVLHWGCVFHKQSLRPMLGGMLIWIKNNLHNSYSVDIYARDVAQIFLLVHCLYAVLRVDSDIYLASPAQAQVNARIFYDSVCSEVDLVTSKFIEWTENYVNMETNDMESRISIKIPRDIFSDFIKKYQKLELSTDLLNLQI